MENGIPIDLIAERYREVHGAGLPRTFDRFMTRASEQGSTAALGYRCADEGSLYLECYLDEAVEAAVSRALGKAVLREEIVELGNFAAVNGMAMVRLWGTAANDLSAVSKVAVATLTAQVRTMFARVGVSIVELAPAKPESVGDATQRWGRYYDADPIVCAGIIAEGQEALVRHFARRDLRRAA